MLLMAVVLEISNKGAKSEQGDELKEPTTIQGGRRGLDQESIVDVVIKDHILGTF